METKYKNGKIYKITDNSYTKCYYGSTVNSLAKRFSGHKTDYILFLANRRTNITIFSIFDEFGVENCKIELVELFPCNSKIELHQREGFYIKNNDCVNKMTVGRTQKEYREDNKEVLQEYFKQHYQDNKEHKLQLAENYRNKPEIKEKNKEYHKQYLEIEINREKNKERCRAFKEKNKDYDKQYLEKNREYNKARCKAYREKKKLEKLQVLEA
jgi:hypothetical protein